MLVVETFLWIFPILGPLCPYFDSPQDPLNMRTSLLRSMSCTLFMSYLEQGAAFQPSVETLFRSLLPFPNPRDCPGLLRQFLKFRETTSSFSEKMQFSSSKISFYVWDHISEGKACIKNPKTCGHSKWPPLTNGMSCSCGRSVSIEKPYFKQRSSLSISCFI